MFRSVLVLVLIKRPLIFSSLVGRAFSSIDNGDVNINVLNINAVLKDLSRRGGKQALANGQAVAVIGELSTGRTGCACAAADVSKTTFYFINLYADDRILNFN